MVASSPRAMICRFASELQGVLQQDIRAPGLVTHHQADLAYAIMLSPELGHAPSGPRSGHTRSHHDNSSDGQSVTVRVLRPRANKDDMGSQRRSPSVEALTEPPDALNWLPYVGLKAPIWTSKAMCENLIQKRKHRDWFAAFASALHEIKKDSTQSKMVTKMYVFLREFIPRGLTGVSLSLS